VSVRSLACLVLGLALAAGAAVADEAATSSSTADHSTFEALEQTFASGPEVTAACLACHTEADDQVMHTIHFTWDFTHPTTGQRLGKRHVINVFCGNVAANEPRCTSCHAGYGWDDMREPPPQRADAVDCLVCHDRSGQYAKLDDAAGHPPLAPVAPGAKTVTGAAAMPVDLAEAAQSVGRPARENCGTCHFYGGGGDNVKHGDLSSVLIAPERSVDVHMSPDGADMVCADCHVSNRHQWPGSRYAVTAADPEGTGLPGRRRDVATCQSCHGNAPHPSDIRGAKLDDHTDVLACQSCHIPAFARGGVATKTYWDWSTAGRLDAAGKPISTSGFVQSNGEQRHTYLSTKGDFAWGEDVMPVYAWFDGQVAYTTADREIDPTQTVPVNRIDGDREDQISRIWPFKRMAGRQAYDAGLNRLVYTQVWGPQTDTALWTNLDWAKAIEAGMAAAGADYSGTFGFVDTTMHWPVTHMVAPAEAAVSCGECHAAGGRMAGITDIALPGQTPTRPAALLGLALIGVTFAAVLGHAVLRRLAEAGSHG